MGLLLVMVASTVCMAAPKLRIGLSMDTLKEERWQKDRDIFIAEAKKRGAEVLVQSANSDDALQVSQAENLLSQGVDVLVVIPHNAEACATIVESAKKSKVPVIAYDRLIKNCNLDLYISFDNEQVGYLQASYITKLKPTGTYVYIGGAPTDNNAYMFKAGAMKVLDPLVKAGKIKIAYDQFTNDWKPEVAQSNMENALTKLNNKVDAVVAANDGTAGGVIQALTDQKLAGKVPVSGQDADLAACQRIVEGTQAMTVYKPIKKIAVASAQAAVLLAQGKKVKTNKTVDNGKIKVPFLALTPVQVDKSNMFSAVIKDGFHKLEDVYRNVPKNEWPK
ncbi:D-xylose ABC transporter substrate-binding protein [Hydrogenispora ethanolica]|jgi:D-xylose transport system substrate-binding protein|nr:D-xylose ABC transporter substrate-binding protein [Hydrogenispora ethanolica]